MRTITRVAVFAVATLLALSAGFVALNWAPDRPVAMLAARWAPPPSRFLPLEGMQVHLRDEGPRADPQPLVLLHGTSASLHTWEGWAVQLKATRRVIRVDLPGFGLTGPEPSGNYTIERYVRFTVALLDALGVQHCILVGNSFGGWVAWETALALPGRVDRLVLVDAAGYEPGSISVPIAFRVAGIPILNEFMKVTLPRRMIESSLRNVYGDPARVTPELVDRYFDLTTRAGNREGLVQRFAQAPLGQHAGRIAQLKVPTLIVWGGRDRLIPPDNAERFKRDIAGSQLVLFPDLGHVPQEEDPARTVAALQSFLAQT